jgi:hypothetical protein
MISRYKGAIGRILPIPLIGEIEAIALMGTMSLEFRLLRHLRPTILPMAIEALAGWQAFDPRKEQPCYTTLYPVPGGIRGLEAAGLGLETRGLLVNCGFTLLVWNRA